MSGKTVAVIGATGMIGGYLTKALLRDSFFHTVRVIVRQPVQKTHPRMEVKLVDFNDAESLKLALEETDTVFCCIGTTQNHVKGDKELYRAIDLDIPLRTARFCKEAGCEQFIIITSVGASSKSRAFYLKLKGELEDALENIGFHSIHIMQPGVLLGTRHEQRPGERIAQRMTKLLSRLFIGKLRKFRPIHGKVVAAAMLNAAKEEKEGIFRYTFDEIVEMSETVRF